MLRGEMRIAKRHGRRGVSKEIADCRQWDASHNEPGREGMAKIMEMKVGQPCGLAGPFKAMSYIVPPMPPVIVEDPRHIDPHP